MGCFKAWMGVTIRVSNETSFALKKPKLEPKIVSVFSEKKCLFRLFRFHAETACYGVSIEPKHSKNKAKHLFKVTIWLNGWCGKPSAMEERQYRMAKSNQ